MHVIFLFCDCSIEFELAVLASNESIYSKKCKLCIIRALLVQSLCVCVVFAALALQEGQERAQISIYNHSDQKHILISGVLCRNKE